MNKQNVIECFKEQKMLDNIAKLIDENEQVAFNLGRKDGLLSLTIILKPTKLEIADKNKVKDKELVNSAETIRSALAKPILITGETIADIEEQINDLLINGVKAGKGALNGYMDNISDAIEKAAKKPAKKATKPKPKEKKEDDVQTPLFGDDGCLNGSCGG